MVHRMVEAMSQLQEEKARLQEELAALREKLALHDSDQTATSTQLQNQVPGEDGTGRGHCPPWNRSADLTQLTWNPQTTSIIDRWRLLSAGECMRGQGGENQRPGPPILVIFVPHSLWLPGARTYPSRVTGSTRRCERSRKGQGLLLPQVYPLFQAPWSGQPEETKVIAEVTP